MNCYLKCKDVGTMDAILDILPRETRSKAMRMASSRGFISFSNLTDQEFSFIDTLSEKFKADIYQDLLDKLL